LSTEEDKFKHSKRLLKDENAVKKQVKIAKEHGVPIKDSHKFAKRHVMNCGNPKCVMCANPRKIFKELSAGNFIPLIFGSGIGSSAFANSFIRIVALLNVFMQQ
jgi:hypothetical protein